MVLLLHNFVLLKNSLSNSMEQNFSWKAISCSERKEILTLRMLFSVPRPFRFITLYLTPRKRVLLEKRVVAQLGRKPTAFYGI